MPHQDSLCVSCRSPKTSFECPLCQEPVCKNCLQTLPEDAFSFRKSVSKDLEHGLYCRLCYDEKVAPEVESYNETMERAKQGFIFFIGAKRRIPILDRSKKKVAVEKCIDRDETILRLAFLAAELGFNAVIEVDVNSEQVRNHGYQSSIWRGTGFPAQVDGEKIHIQDERDRFFPG